jgi:hypothetical protein
MVELFKADFLESMIVQMIFKWLHQVQVDSMDKIIMIQMMIWGQDKLKRRLVL